MSAEEIVKIAVGYVINWVGILVAGYFWLVIKNVRKDVDGVAQTVRRVEKDVEKLEEICTCLKIAVGKIEQTLKDNEKLCNERHTQK